ncbi:V-type proton ATPase subunit E [Linum perenne]
MNDADVPNQIQQMCRFIRQEAEEKANEIPFLLKKYFFNHLFSVLCECCHGNSNGSARGFQMSDYFSMSLQEFNIEKLQLLEVEKKKIRQEFERKEKQVDVRKKIEYSMQLNASRIKVLQAQDDVVNSMKEVAAKDILNVSRDHHSYKKLLHNLIVQVRDNCAQVMLL